MGNWMDGWMEDARTVGPKDERESDSILDMRMKRVRNERMDGLCFDEFTEQKGLLALTHLHFTTLEHRAHRSITIGTTCVQPRCSPLTRCARQEPLHSPGVPRGSLAFETTFFAFRGPTLSLNFLKLFDQPISYNSGAIPKTMCL